MVPDVTIIVVTYNSAHVVSGLLDSLDAALGGRAAETIVVDNGSIDGTVELLTGRQDCVVIPSTNVGYAGGINRGARASIPGSPLLILNPDIRLGAGAVPVMLNALTAPGTGVVAPLIRNTDGKVCWSLRREPTLARALGLSATRLPVFAEYCNRNDDYASPHVVEWALGAALLVDRACFDALDGWDESFFLYSEETDFCLRARDAGWLTRFEPSAVVMHIGKASGYNEETHSMQILNRVRLYARRHGSIASWAYFALALGSEGYRAAIGVRQSRAAVAALLLRSRRPPQLNCSEDRLPR